MARTKQGKKYTISTCVCINCGLRMYVPRTKQREKGHVKTMWCIGCNSMSDFAEYREFDHPEVMCDDEV